MLDNILDFMQAMLFIASCNPENWLRVSSAERELAKCRLRIE